MTDATIPPRKALNLKFRVKCFFAANPDEELTPTLLREKFGLTKWTGRWVLRELVEEGTLESVHVIRLRTSGIAKEIS